MELGASEAVGPLTEPECIEELRRLRDQISVETADWEPHRSLLREAMIETFVRQRFTDQDQWFDKVPGYLRQRTNPAEKGRYLDRVCDIVSRLAEGIESEMHRPAPQMPANPSALGPASSRSPTERFPVPKIRFAGS
jgi:hypothetical protein